MNEQTLQTALAALPPTVYRAKGFVSDTRGGLVHVEYVSGAGRIEPWANPVPDEARDVLTVIGTEALTEQSLSKSLSMLDGATLEGPSEVHVHDPTHEQ